MKTLPAVTRSVSHPMKFIVDGDGFMRSISMQSILGKVAKATGNHGFSIGRAGCVLLSPCEGSNARAQ